MLGLNEGLNSQGPESIKEEIAQTGQTIKTNTRNIQLFTLTYLKPRGAEKIIQKYKKKESENQGMEKKTKEN